MLPRDSTAFRIKSTFFGGVPQISLDLGPTCLSGSTLTLQGHQHSTPHVLLCLGIYVLAASKTPFSVNFSWILTSFPPTPLLFLPHNLQDSREPKHSCTGEMFYKAWLWLGSRKLLQGECACHRKLSNSRGLREGDKQRGLHQIFWNYNRWP